MKKFGVAFLVAAAVSATPPALAIGAWTIG